MNHNVTLAIVAIVAATALTAIPFAVPQQALAGGHHHKHNSNGVKVDQQISQANFCNGTNPTPPPPPEAAAQSSSSSTTCVNLGDNQADISK
jgi:hypothetical protein